MRPPPNAHSLPHHLTLAPPTPHPPHPPPLSFDFFGFKTLEKSYLLRVDGEVAERPQQMFLRVAVGIHKEDIDAAIETYDLMSRRFFTHATPTLFNGGTPRPQLSSCFLLTMRDDSIDGIYDTLKNCACISKFAGGIGLSIHNIRATNSYIRGTNGTSNGIVPMLRVFNDTARYVDQGGGKRKGSFAIYLEPWHADIYDFLELKKNTGKDEARARDLFYALWTPDLFMERVEANGTWSLFCPNEAPGLADVCGADFKALYETYEKEGRARKVVQAQHLWFEVLKAQIETGVPYMLYKDAANLKSNQKNLGVIKSSNLCTEIIEYTAPDEIAVCNLASIALNMFVVKGADGRPAYDFVELTRIAKVVTRNLNKVIDVNYYPVPEAERSNMRHRPIGIGVQGLADTFAMMKLPFEDPGAMELNTCIFEAIYYGAVEASCELAELHGPYASFAGSPASKGQLQFDMWNVKPSSGRFDWDALKARVVKHGLRNSLLLAPMPTASTAQILGNNESTEPFTSNVYNRRVLAGEFPVVNKHLLRDLIEAGLWTPEVRLQIIADRGSIQRVKGIPEHLKDLYKTVWEIKQKTIIDQAANRGAYICQSQSLNIHMAGACAPTRPKVLRNKAQPPPPPHTHTHTTDPNNAKLTSMHFYAWKAGLKTGMYYLRTRQKVDAIQFTVDQLALKEARDTTAIVSGSITAGSKGFAFPTSASSGAATAAGTAPGGTPGPKLAVIAAESPSDSESASSSRDGSPLMFTPQARRTAAAPAEGGAAASAGGGGGGGAPAGASPAPLLTPEERAAAYEAKARAAAEARAKAKAEFEAQTEAEQAGQCLNCGS